MMQANAMMNGYPMHGGCPMMMGGAGTAMMIGIWVVWLLTIAILILGIMALLKYLRSPPRP